MKATATEFRHRFVIISLIFCAGFMLYFVDHVNVLEAIARAAHAGDRRTIKVLLGCATALLLAAAAVRTWATAYLRASVVHDTHLHTDKLVGDGPYRFVRNPLYLGNILLAIGMGALASRIGCAVIVLGNCLFVLRLIGREETELANQHGAAYRHYVEAVPRLLPALRPRVPPSGTRPAWRQGFAGEAFFWMLAAAVAAVAVTLQSRWFFSVLIAAFVVRVIAVKLLVRKAENRAAAAK